MSRLLTAEDVVELAKSLRDLPEERVAQMRALLRPSAADQELGVEDSLRYWLANEPNPTRERLLEKIEGFLGASRASGGEAEEQTSGSTGASFVSKLFGTFSGSAKLARGKGRELIDACRSGDRATVSSLLGRGIKPDQTHKHLTPLIAASLMGHLDIVQDLRKAKASVHFTGKDARTALHAASTNGHLNVVEFLLDNGASVNSMDGEEQTALHEAAFQGHPKVVALLVRRGADIDRQSDDGSTPLHVASSGGDEETVKLLLYSKAKTSIRTTKWGRTPLHYASSRGHTKVVEMLLQAKIDINDGDKNGMTPLIFAVLSDRTETMEYLIKAGANLDAQNKVGKTALMFAVEDKKLEVARFLAEAGADIDVQDYGKGWSAIFFAIEKGDMSMSLLLCEFGADLDLLDKNKKNCLDVARKYSPTVYKELLKIKTTGLKNPDLPRIQGKEPTKEEGLEKQEGGGTGEKGGAKEVPSYYEYSEKYPGIRFFGDPWKESVTKEGKLIDYWEKEIGVKFDIPRGAVPEGKQLDLSVWPCTAGPFVFPEGYELASPVYQIAPSFEFQCDITLTLHHFCAVETAEQCESMAFLSSSATPSVLQQHEPQYRFKVLSRGSFLPSEAYGSVSLKHFCNVAVGVKRKRSSHSESPKGKRIKDEAIKNKYALKVFHKVPEDMVVFSASLRQPEFFTRLKSSLLEYFPGVKFRPGPEQPADICGSKVEWHWPKDKGWELFPDTMPCEISRDTLDSHESADYPPMIKVDIKPIPDQTSGPPPSSHIEVEVLGVSEKRLFMLAPTVPATRKTIMPVGSPLSPTPSSPQYSPYPPYQPYQPYPYPPMEYRSRISSLSHSSTYSPEDFHEYSLHSSSSSSCGLFSPHPVPYSHSMAYGMSMPPAINPESSLPFSSLSVQGVQRPHLKDLLNNIVTIDWYKLGLQLTDDDTEMNIIMKDHGSSTHDAIRETFTLCLRQDPELTWQKVVDALREIKENHLARDIEEKFCH